MDHKVKLVLVLLDYFNFLLLPVVHYFEFYLRDLAALNLSELILELELY